MLFFYTLIEIIRLNTGMLMTNDTARILARIALAECDELANLTEGGEEGIIILLFGSYYDTGDM